MPGRSGRWPAAHIRRDRPSPLARKDTRLYAPRFQVSALSKTIRPEAPSDVFPPGSGPQTITADEPDGEVYDNEPEDPVIWREMLMEDHPGFIDPARLWNEDDPFLEAEDVIDGLEDFFLTAVVILHLGDAGAAAFLAGREDISEPEVVAVLERPTEDTPEDDSPIRFAQIGAVTATWLPTDSEDLVEVIDWHGQEQIIGSVVHLATEIEAMKTFILKAEPEAVAQLQPATDDDDVSTVLGRALVVCEIVGRLAAVAIERNLPLTGVYLEQ